MGKLLHSDPEILYERYSETLRNVALLKNVQDILNLDRMHSLPKAGLQIRSEQIWCLGSIVHSMITDPHYLEILQRLQGHELNDIRRRNVAVSVQEAIREAKIPRSIVEELSRTIPLAEEAYAAAKASNDFTVFAPFLNRLIELKRSQAACLAEEGETPYEALLHDFDAWITEAELDNVFTRMKEELVPLMRSCRSLEQDFKPLHQEWTVQGGNETLLHKIATEMGFDFERGSLQASTSTFMFPGNPNDTRMFYATTASNPFEWVMEALHELGHSQYEQSLNPQYLGLPMARFASYTVHESLARLFENHVGRSREYLSHIQEFLVRSNDIDSTYGYVNHVQPGILRTKSDELSYHLHILIRYELERDLINGVISVEDLPKLWNQKYQEYLGLEIKDDSEWILQDFHWSRGWIGYFPTYSLGTFYAAQLFAKIEEEIPDLRGKISRGELLEIKSWLNQKVHSHGRLLTSSEILEFATSSKLDIGYFLRYAKEKYGKLYWLES